MKKIEEETTETNMLKYKITDFIDNEIETMRSKILDYITKDNKKKLMIFVEKEIEKRFNKIGKFIKKNKGNNEKREGKAK